MSHTLTPLRRRGLFLLAVVLGLTAVADTLFYKQPLGVNAALFGLAVAVALALRGGRFLRRGPGRWVTLATAAMLGALVLHPGVLPMGMCLLGLATLAIIDRDGWTWSVTQWAERWARFARRATTQMVRDVALQRRWLRTHRGRVQGVAGVGVWLIPVVLSLVFVGLFAAANPVVQRWVQWVWEALQGRVVGLSEWVLPGRIVLWLGVGVAAWGMLRTRVKRRTRQPRMASGGSAALDRFTPTALVVRCLLLFNVVFAGQTLMDLYYLVGGAALPEGLTYAAYARRGAYPLVATALLAGAFVLLAFRPGGVAQKSPLARRLVMVWIAQNVLLMVSAGWRLNLYVQAYSLTRWRLAAALWMVLVAVGFVWLVWRIASQRDNAWLLQRVALTAGVMFYALCFVNPDGAIARFNTAHCAEAGGAGGPLDLVYLESLGPESLPALGAFVSAHPVRTDAWESVARLQLRLNRQLANWRGWTWRRATLIAEPSDAWRGRVEQISLR